MAGGVEGSFGSNTNARSLLVASSPLMSPFTTAEMGRPFCPTYRPPRRTPHPSGTDPAMTNLCLKSVSDGPQEPERSRGSLLIAVYVVEVRARQQPNVVLSSASLYVYDASSDAPRGSAAVASTIAACWRASPVFVSSSTRQDRKSVV